MKNSRISTPILMVILVVVLWIFYPIVLHHFEFDANNKGLFGDSFGAFNALVSGLALIGIAYSIMQQQKQLQMQSTELSLQREELSLTRNELMRAAEAQELSSLALTKQVEKIEINAKLATLTALFNAYRDLSIKESGLPWRQTEIYRKKKEEIANKLEELGNEILS